MSDAVTFSNPSTVHPPAGAYSHCSTVPAGASLLFVAGQVGIRPDGSVGETLEEQAEQAYANLVAVLEAGGMTPADVVQLTTYLVAAQDPAPVGAARRRHFGEHRPASTAIYVPALFSPAWLVEVQAIAAKAPRQIV